MVDVFVSYLLILIACVCAMTWMLRVRLRLCSCLSFLFCTVSVLFFCTVFRILVDVVEAGGEFKMNFSESEFSNLAADTGQYGYFAVLLWFFSARDKPMLKNLQKKLSSKAIDALGEIEGLKIRKSKKKGDIREINITEVVETLVSSTIRKLKVFVYLKEYGLIMNGETEEIFVKKVFRHLKDVVRSVSEVRDRLDAFDALNESAFSGSLNYVRETLTSVATPYIPEFLSSAVPGLGAYFGRNVLNRFGMEVRDKKEIEKDPRYAYGNVLYGKSVVSLFSSVYLRTAEFVLCVIVLSIWLLTKRDVKITLWGSSLNTLDYLIRRGVISGDLEGEGMSESRIFYDNDIDAFIANLVTIKGEIEGADSKTLL